MIENENSPLVSVIINCFNGEKYLKEAIDSIYSQTYNNWEIVFVDNCSDDNSAQIAEGYGTKVKYYKTNTNIPLGAARNFGIQFCKGDYASFLDVDDIWLPDALETLVIAITSGDYALAYGGRIGISSSGEVISERVPTYGKGCLIEKLLFQFDIPIVASIVSLRKLKDSRLNFDISINASEEYCLYMQLAAKYKVYSISKSIVKYRVHGDSLSSSTMHLWANERRYTLDKITSDNPSIKDKYVKAWREANARAVYYEIQCLMKQCKKQEARKIAFSVALVSIKYFMIFILLFAPYKLWYKLQKMKYKR